MKIAVTASKEIRRIRIEGYFPQKTTELIIPGDRELLDEIAEYAQQNGIPIRKILPDYDRYGRKAEFFCIKQLLESCDMLVALWNGEEDFTASLVKYARKIHKPVCVYWVSH